MLAATVHVATAAAWLVAALLLCHRPGLAATASPAPRRNTPPHTSLASLFERRFIHVPKTAGTSWIEAAGKAGKVVGGQSMCDAAIRAANCTAQLPASVKAPWHTTREFSDFDAAAPLPPLAFLRDPVTREREPAVP